MLQHPHYKLQIWATGKMADTRVESFGEVTQASSSQALVQAKTQHYINAATADNTRRAYRSAIRQFEKWGGRLPCQPFVINRYLSEKAESLNPRTLDLHLTAIRQWHRFQQFTDPTLDSNVLKTLEGIRRLKGKPKRKAKALRLEHIAEMVDVLQQSDTLTLKQQRDLAIVLVGFFGGFRRGELVCLAVSHLQWEPEGLLIVLDKSKTDQVGKGLSRAIPYCASQVCAASALKAWLTSASITEGPVFRAINRWDQIAETALNAGSINLILKSIGEQCGWGFIPELSSHSFRRGVSTSAAREKIDFELIKKQGGWKSDATVWEYIEEGQQFSENAAILLMEKLSLLMKPNSVGGS